MPMTPSLLVARRAFVSCFAALSFLLQDASAQVHKRPKNMPKADVVEVPAIANGLCVHQLFQSHMVLQRGKPLRIWGWSKPGETITLRFAGDEAKTKAGPDRSWSATLPAQSASSEARDLTISNGAREIRLEDVLVGDVWVLGGQSNMEFPLERVDNGWLEIVSARYRQIRILTVPAQKGPKTRRSFPRLWEWSGWNNRHFRKGDWDVCSPEIVQDLSAIGYVFARRIHMASGVPIGVIDASRGGTTVETWTPEAVLRGIATPEVTKLMQDWDARCASWDAEADLAKRIQNHERRVAQRKKQGQSIPANWKRPADVRPGPLFDHNRPGNCYRNIIAPLAGFAVKGAIFHQGYNNALTGAPGARMYHQLFGEMIASWRKAFDDPAMPFGIISLCTDAKPQTADNYCESMLDSGVYIREAQYQTFLAQLRAGDENIGFASSYDKRRAWYHPQLKIPVGERIARWALATEYGFKRRIRWKPPMCTKLERMDDRIVLHFDRAVGPAESGAEIVGFSIAGEDRRFHPAKAEWLVRGKDGRGRPKADRKVLVLTSTQVAKPLHYRYAWARNPMANLQSTDHSDLPFATQRSDDWPIHDVPRGVLKGQSLENGRLSRKQRNTIRRVLRQQDLERRKNEARALLAK